MKASIIIDLDVVTVSEWDKKGKNVEIAKKFISRLENKEFSITTPFFLLELVAKWKYDKLKDRIEDFYIKFTDRMLSNEDLDEKIDSLNIDDKKIINELMHEGIKDEDSLLVLICSIFNVDYVITFNKIHLKNKKEIINQVLKKNGLNTIKIVGPEEV